MTAPMVVTNWINMQYHASTVDNRRYGSGNKVLHNVVGGRIGVFEGNGGDLRIGLPMQSLHDGHTLRHAPLRLSVFIEAPRHDRLGHRRPRGRAGPRRQRMAPPAAHRVGHWRRGAMDPARLGSGLTDMGARVPTCRVTVVRLRSSSIDSERLQQLVDDEDIDAVLALVTVEQIAEAWCRYTENGSERSFGDPDWWAVELLMEPGVAARRELHRQLLVRPRRTGRG